MSQGSSVYRLFRKGPQAMPLSVALNLFIILGSICLLIGGELADGIVQTGMGFAVMLGTAVGVTATGLVNVLIDLTGPSN